MKTTIYNPSQLEVEFAQAIENVKSELENKLSDKKIIKIENKITADNPSVKFHLLDQDGDPHEIVLKVIQIPDKF